MVQMGLGIRGLQNVAKGGFLLSLVVGAGIEILDFIFNDEKTMHDLVGGIGVEAVKAGLAGLATMVGLGLGIKLATATFLAILPLAAVAVAVLVTGIILNQIDDDLKIKQHVINMLRISTSSMPQGIYRINIEKLNLKNQKTNHQIEYKLNDYFTEIFKN